MIKRFGKNLVLLEKLASGGMAEVYRAKQVGHGGFQKTVALKRILPQYASKEDFKRMFREEANLSAVLQHPNIVQIFSNGEQDKYLYLVMEYVNGKNVRQLLAACDKAKIRIPIDVSCYIIAEAAKGLACAHDAIDELNQRPLNIIHRDVSPQNLMLSYNGLVKIVDFGIAKAANQSEETRAGVLKGKFGYMSPEQAQGMTLDSRSDIFSLGIVLFEMLTQRRLFTTKDDMKTLKLVQQCRVPRPSKYNPSVESALDNIVLKALSKDRSDRYQSAEDFFYELQSYISQKHPQFKLKKLSSMLMKIFSDKIKKEKEKQQKANEELAAFSFDLEDIPSDPGQAGDANLHIQDFNDKKDYDAFLNNLDKGKGTEQDQQEAHPLAQKEKAPADTSKSKEENAVKAPENKTAKGGGDREDVKSSSEQSSLMTNAGGVNEISSGVVNLKNDHQGKSLSANAAYDLGDDIFENEEAQPTTARVRMTASNPVSQDEADNRRPWGKIAVAVVLVLGAYFITTMPEQSRQQLVCGIKAKIGFPLCGSEVQQRDKAPAKIVDNTPEPDRNPAAIHYPWKEKSKVPKGILNLTSVPDANEIYINGQQLIDPQTRKPAGTPLRNYTMKPGIYDVELRSTVFGLSVKKQIEIKSDAKEDHLEVILAKPE